MISQELIHILIQELIQELIHILIQELIHVWIYVCSFSGFYLMTAIETKYSNKLNLELLFAKC